MWCKGRENTLMNSHVYSSPSLNSYQRTTNLVSSVAFKFIYPLSILDGFEASPRLWLFYLGSCHWKFPLCLFPSWNFSFLGVIFPEVSSDFFLFCHILHIYFILFSVSFLGDFLKFICRYFYWVFHFSFLFWLMFLYLEKEISPSF